MSRCLIARTAVLAIRERSKPPVQVTVAFPAGWSRSTLLAYARAEHGPLGESVRIVEWGKSHDEWTPRLYLANPVGFSDYRRGVRV